MRTLYSLFPVTQILLINALLQIFVVTFHTVEHFYFCFEELFAPCPFPRGITTPVQLFADLLATHDYFCLLTAFYINSLRMRCAVVTSDTSLKLQGVWRQSSTHYSPRPQDDGMFGWLKCLGHIGEE